MSAATVDDARRLVEALLFASRDPVDRDSLAARLPDGSDLESVLQALAADYADRGVNLVRVGDKWAFRTAADLAGRLRIETEVRRKLSRAAVETLAIIAYHQPVTRAEIEEIRGVGQSRGTLDILLEAGWIRPGRRRRTPGRPLTWQTTEHFLDHFGLADLDNLPGLEDLRVAGLLDARPAVGIYREGSAMDEAEEREDGDEDDAFDATDRQSNLVEFEKS